MGARSDNVARQIRRCAKCGKDTMRCREVIRFVKRRVTNGYGYEFKCNNCKARMGFESSDRIFSRSVAFVIGAFGLGGVAVFIADQHLRGQGHGSGPLVVGGIFGLLSVFFLVGIVFTVREVVRKHTNPVVGEAPPNRDPDQYRAPNPSGGPRHGNPNAPQSYRNPNVQVAPAATQGWTPPPQPGWPHDQGGS